MKHALSFKYDGVPFSELSYTVATDGDKTIYTLPDGIKITVVEEHFPEFNITKWTNYWENPTDHEGGVITELCDCDVSLTFEKDIPRTRRYMQDTWEYDMLEVLETVGANVTQDDHWIRSHRLWDGNNYCARNICGRSGMGTAPFFEVRQKERGVLVAIGWTGQWISNVDRKDDQVRIRTGILNVSLAMEPGEKFRTGSVTILEYENGSENAHNLFRKYIREKISPMATGKGARGKQSPFSAIFWGGVPSKNLIDRWQHIFDAKLPFDTCWIDAGWYEPLRAMTTDEQTARWGDLGIWKVNEFYHPNGYKDVVKFLNDHGVDFMVWFEPERQIPKIGSYTEYIRNNNPESITGLTALQKDNVRDDVIKTIGDLIEEIGIKVYRQDFNADPQPFWDAEDARQNGGKERRLGSTEIHYINNLWKFWDALLERFPGLLIDDCCGGGHRIDIEMLSRSIPLWRSDYQCTWNCCPEANQNQNAWASYWYPYSGIGYGPDLGDTYSFRSAWTNGMTVRTWEHVDPEWEFENSGVPVEWAKKNFDQYNELRHYFAEDFYSLIKPSHDNATWLASQYHDSHNDSGMILAFRRALSPYEKAYVTLKGLDKTAKYQFTNEDSGEKFIISGNAVDKFELTINNTRESLLLTYKKI